MTRGRGRLRPHHRRGRRGRACRLGHDQRLGARRRRRLHRDLGRGQRHLDVLVVAGLELDALVDHAVAEPQLQRVLAGQQAKETRFVAADFLLVADVGPVRLAGIVDIVIKPFGPIDRISHRVPGRKEREKRFCAVVGEGDFLGYLSVLFVFENGGVKVYDLLR